MGPTATAERLGAAHAVGTVFLDCHVFLPRRLPEAGPTRARIELVLGAEQLSTAAHAAVLAFLVIVPVGAGEGRLGAFLARHVILVRSELLAPFRVRLLDLGHIAVYSCRHSSLVTRHSGRTLPGFMMPCGSKVALSARIRPSSTPLL